MEKQLDYLGNFGLAHRLARQIEEYWHKRGYTGVKTRVIKDTSFERPLYYVRSNLRLRAWPRKAH